MVTALQLRAFWLLNNRMHDFLNSLYSVRDQPEAHLSKSGRASEAGMSLGCMWSVPLYYLKAHPPPGTWLSVTEVASHQVFPLAVLFKQLLGFQCSWKVSLAFFRCLFLLGYHPSHHNPPASEERH